MRKTLKMQKKNIKTNILKHLIKTFNFIIYKVSGNRL